VVVVRRVAAAVRRRLSEVLTASVDHEWLRRVGPVGRQPLECPPPVFALEERMGQASKAEAGHDVADRPCGYLGTGVPYSRGGVSETEGTPADFYGDHLRGTTFELRLWPRLVV